MATVYPAVMALYGPVQRAVRAQLRRQGFRPHLSAEAAACVALAARLDACEGAAAAANCARELRLALAALAQQAKPDESASARARALETVGWDPGDDAELQALALELGS